MDPDTLEGPCREAVVTAGAHSSIARQCHGKSVPKGFRARDITEWETTAASFKFNGIVYVLQAKLDSREKLIRPVKPVKDKESRANVGAGENRRLGLESLLMEKFDLLLDRRSPEPRRRSSEDHDCTLKVDAGSDFRRRYRPGCQVTSGYGSLASGGRRAESVAWETPRGCGSSRVRFEDSSDEDRSSIRKQDSLSEADRLSRMGRRASVSRSPNIPPKAPCQASAVAELGSMKGSEVGAEERANQMVGHRRASGNVPEIVGTIRCVIRAKADETTASRPFRSLERFVGRRMRSAGTETESLRPV